jgi:TRAP-type C4-dicarboxylate transport system permease small subunit
MRAIEAVLRTVAAGCLLAVMLIIFSDVIARYFFNSPLIWTYELVGMYLMPALFYFAVSDTLAEDHHIAVDVLCRWFPVPLRRIIEALSSALMAAIFFWLIWLFGQSAFANYRSGAVVMGAREWPTWIPELIVVIGSTAIALRLCGRVAGHLVSLLTGKPVIGLPRSTLEG